ncbi:hypothetical protein ACFS4T_24935 [Pseudomonas lini]
MASSLVGKKNATLYELDCRIKDPVAGELAQNLWERGLPAKNDDA